MKRVIVRVLLILEHALQITSMCHLDIVDYAAYPPHFVVPFEQECHASWVTGFIIREEKI
jgi:hypothetical protein